MKSFTSICACVCALFFAACTSSIPEYKPVAAAQAKSAFEYAYTGFGADAKAVGEALNKALLQRGWIVEGQTPRGLVARRVHADRTAVARFVVADNRITIDTAGSTIGNKTSYIPETDLSFLLASVKENLKMSQAK
ncbi:MAG: hypothetical protein IKO42_03045 [Opitutales bacterium]|nr:hypothetical protein [Opitutales bacterium]